MLVALLTLLVGWVYLFWQPPPIRVETDLGSARDGTLGRYCDALVDLAGWERWSSVFRCDASCDPSGSDGLLSLNLRCDDGRWCDTPILQAWRSKGNCSLSWANCNAQRCVQDVPLNPGSHSSWREYTWDSALRWERQLAIRAGERITLVQTETLGGWLSPLVYLTQGGEIFSWFVAHGDDLKRAVR